MRKLTLFTVSGLVLLATMGLGAQAAFAVGDDPNVWCTPENAYKGNGIYDTEVGSGKYKKFTLATSPKTQFAVSEITGGAHLCGTDPDPGGPNDNYLAQIDVGTPAELEEIHCANPANVGAYCASQTDPDLPEEGKIGDATVSSWCPDENILCGNGLDAPDIQAENYTIYDTGRQNQFNNDPNRCTPEAIACAEARVIDAVPGVNCYADLITTETGDGGFTFSIYPSNCYAGANEEFALQYPIYVYDIASLRICKYQGSAAIGDCPPEDASKWIVKNGRARASGKPWKWTAKATMTQGNTFAATAKVKWTL